MELTGEQIQSYLEEDPSTLDDSFELSINDDGTLVEVINNMEVEIGGLFGSLVDIEDGCKCLIIDFIHKVN